MYDILIICFTLFIKQFQDFTLLLFEAELQTVQVQSKAAHAGRKYACCFNLSFPKIIFFFTIYKFFIKHINGMHDEANTKGFHYISYLFHCTLRPLLAYNVV